MRALVAGSLLALIAAPGAQAAFPGQNGKIAYSKNPTVGSLPNVFSISPDGSGETQLTHPPGIQISPAWSPDGQKIAFHADGAIHMMNADGSNVTALTDGSLFDVWPEWSPDGTKIVFSRRACTGCTLSLYKMNADGSNQLPVLPGEARYPSWAPDGSKIAFSRDFKIHLVNPDGTGLVQLAGQPGPGENTTPDWSPDSQKLAFSHDGCEGVCELDPVFDLYTIERDGSGLTQIAGGFITHSAWSPDGTKIAYSKGMECLNACYRYDIVIRNADGSGTPADITDGPRGVNHAEPSWQPIWGSGYARPRGATPTRVSLVSAYRQCTSSDRTHGPPLAFGACNPPVQESNELTVGTPDSNGAQVNMTGYVQYASIVGNPSTPADEADIALRVEVTDVREQGSLDDYAGELRAGTTVRLTDRTASAGDPATSNDVLLPLVTQCAPTALTVIGSTCSLDTTLDALIPGAIAEGQRTILSLGQVSVIDGGPDGDTATTPNTVFLRQGVFVP